MKLNIGILYLGLHNQLEKKYGANSTISIKEFFIKIGKHGQIPKSLRPVVLKEMQEKNLIERINRDTLRIIPIDIDIEKDTTKFYKMVGIY